MDKYNKSSRRKTRAERQDLHLRATYKRCRVCPIAGKCYRYVQSIITIPVFVCLFVCLFVDGASFCKGTPLCMQLLAGMCVCEN